MFALTHIEYRGQDYTVFETTVAVSGAPSKLMQYATGSIQNWYKKDKIDVWHYTDSSMPDYIIRRILDL